ncbi:MAG: TraB/GumN family protein [Bacilli bacterium]
MKKLSVLLSMMLVAFTLAACGTTEEKQTEKVKWPFYEVTDASGNKMFVLGTVHYGQESMYPFPESIQNAITSSNTLVTEIDMSDAAIAEARGKINRKVTYKSVGELEKYLSSKSKEHLKTRAKEYGVQYTDLTSYKAWYVTNYFSGLAFEQSEATSKYGVDVMVTELAEKHNLKSAFLETADFQISLLDELNPDQTSDESIMAIPSPEKAKQEADKLFSAYKTNTIEKYQEDEMTAEAEYLLLEKRNKNWLPQLEKQLASGEQHFVAVGAAHLNGENGILTLLKQKGYEVKYIG